MLINCICVMYVYLEYIYICPDASVVHVSGSGQLQANPHVAGPWLSLGMLTRRAVATMGSNDLVVGEDHMLGPSCQRYNWQIGRCGSIAFGSSPRRGKTLISNPRCLEEVSTCGKDFRRQPRGKIRSGAPKGGLMLDSDLSPAAPQREGNLPQIKPVWCPRAVGSRQTESPAGHCNHPLSQSSQTLLCHQIS